MSHLRGQPSYRLQVLLAAGRAKRLRLQLAQSGCIVRQRRVQRVDRLRSGLQAERDAGGFIADLLMSIVKVWIAVIARQIGQHLPGEAGKHVGLVGDGGQLRDVGSQVAVHRAG